MMALIHFIFIALLSLESPRLHVHSRSLADVETTTESYEETTTEIPETTSTTTASNTITLDISR